MIKCTVETVYFNDSDIGIQIVAAVPVSKKSYV